MHRTKKPTVRTQVIIGLLGTTLDAGTSASRWERWRPSVSLCQHENLLLHRFELLHSRKYTSLAETILADIRSVSPETQTRAHVVEQKDPWDFQEVYGSLHDFARTYPFKPD